MEIQKLPQIVEQTKSLAEFRSTRLTATFQDREMVVMSTLKQEKLHTLIEIHYSSLPFGSKHPEYWSSNAKFPSDLLKWCSLAGVRNEVDPLIENDVISTLVGEFPHLNENSVVDALKMNLRGDLKERYEPYNQINRVFLTKVLCDYEAIVKKANKRAIEIRDRDKIVELSDEQKEQKFREGVMESFRLFKENDDESILTFNMYDLLDSMGRLNITTEKKNEYMSVAKVRLQDILDKPQNRIAITKLDLTETDTKTKVINIAKTLAVADYFRSIEKLEL